MKNLFQQSRFFNLKFASMLVMLFLAIVIAMAFCLPWHQKYNATVGIVTSEGDESVLRNITLDGIIWKNGYQTHFSVAGQAPDVQMQTNTFALEPRSGTWRVSNVLDAFRNELSPTESLIDETNSAFLFAEGTEKTLVFSEKLDDEIEGQPDDRVAVYENIYQPDLVVPAFYFLDADSAGAGWYIYDGKQQVLADYTIAAQENGWKMEYAEREICYLDQENDADAWPQDVYWKSQTIPDAPSSTSGMQLSAQLRGETYVTLPTLAGAVGKNGIYRVTQAQTNTYMGFSSVADLGDPATRADYMAQREAIYTYDIQTPGAPDRITCGLIAHKDTLFLLTAQMDDAQQVGGAAQTTLTLTAVDPDVGTVLDAAVLGSYALQADCPPMLYQNENYLSVGIALASGANMAQAEYPGFTVQSFAFDTATGTLQLCDDKTFVRCAFGDISCLQDVYFDGNTLFLMETSTYYVGDNFEANVVYKANFLGRDRTQRMMAFRGGDCVWQGYLSTDIYQDHLRDYYDSWSSERVVSNLKFHKESEVRA